MKNVCLVVLILSLPVLATVGCTGKTQVNADSRYDTMPEDPRRDTAAARTLTAEAVELIEAGRLEEAESKLKAALEADLFYGPAHNNLGTVYYETEQYYRAAWEYQYAAKLMPNQPQPKYNLGMVYEAVGRLDDAADSYANALDLEPDDVRIAANLARVYVRQNRKDEQTRKLLEDIVLKDNRPHWVSWARERLVLMSADTGTNANFESR